MVGVPAFSRVVRPESRGPGIGVQVPGYAEEQARAGGLNRCSLTVIVDNSGARQLYARVGYQEQKTFQVSRLERKLGFHGPVRMVKPL